MASSSKRSCSARCSGDRAAASGEGRVVALAGRGDGDRRAGSEGGAGNACATGSAVAFTVGTPARSRSTGALAPVSLAAAWGLGAAAAMTAPVTAVAKEELTRAMAPMAGRTAGRATGPVLTVAAVAITATGPCCGRATKKKPRGRRQETAC